MLQREKITHVLNVTSNIPFRCEHLQLITKRLSATDSVIQDIRQYFIEALAFIGTLHWYGYYERVTSIYFDSNLTQRWDDFLTFTASFLQMRLTDLGVASWCIVRRESADLRQLWLLTSCISEAWRSWKPFNTSARCAPSLLPTWASWVSCWPLSKRCVRSRVPFLHLHLHYAHHSRRRRLKLHSQAAMQRKSKPFCAEVGVKCFGRQLQLSQRLVSSHCHPCMLLFAFHETDSFRNWG